MVASDTRESVSTFQPLDLTMGEIRNAIPARLFVRDTARSMAYLVRDLVTCAVFWYAASWIDSPELAQSLAGYGYDGLHLTGIRYVLWLTYWWFQGLAFTGVWVIGHECGHGAFSASSAVCDWIGFVTHTFLWTPYFSWRISHYRHHQNHASMEKDEVYVPKTRSDLGLPQHDEALDYDELFGDTPLYTLFMLVRQQLLAFPAYLLFNVSGQKNYPAWTNHFDPNSIIFNKSQRNAVLISNAGILAMIYGVYMACQMFGALNVVKYYGVPWLLVTHWFIMITYLHHTAQEVPHYRSGQWNFQRGAAATVDRPFLGWQGRFFLHDVAHYHVVHHFFPKMPWYHGEEATKYLKERIGSQYLYSDKPVFGALWESYNDCQFVEDEGEVLFYRDRKGHFTRRPAENVEPVVAEE